MSILRGDFCLAVHYLELVLSHQYLVYFGLLSLAITISLDLLLGLRTFTSVIRLEFFFASSIMSLNNTTVLLVVPLESRRYPPVLPGTNLCRQGEVSKKPFLWSCRFSNPYSVFN